MPSIAQRKAGVAVEEEQEERNNDKVSTSLRVGRSSELASALQSTSFDVLRSTLADLRSTTSFQVIDERIEASDARIKFVQELVRSQGVKRLFDTWSVCEDARQTALIPDVLRTLANCINILGAHQPNQDEAEEIMKGLLPPNEARRNEGGESSVHPQYWLRIQGYLTEHGTQAKSRPIAGKGKASVTPRMHSDDILPSALHLVLAMTTFAGSKYARGVFDALPWGMRSFSRLLNMRKRVSQRNKREANKKSAPLTGKSIATLSKPDIRTLWILILLSFLRSPSGGCTPVTLRIHALTLGQEHYAGMLKGLSQDPASIVTYVLLGLHDGILSDDASVKMPRAKVVAMFNEWTCKELVGLYEREDDLVHLTQSEEQHSISDVAHHFLLALCTHPNRGICYADNGWYGRSKNVEEEAKAEADDLADASQNTTKANLANVHNKILLGLLRSLSPSRSAKQSELALRILAASSELVGPYLSTFVNLSPKAASISWLASSTFIGRTLSLPLPEFRKDSDGSFLAPPPSTVCVSAMLPSSLTRSLFVHGLTLSDNLMKSATLSLLVRTIDRLLRFKQLCQDAMSHFSVNEAPQSTRSTSERGVPLHEDIMQGTYGVHESITSPWQTCWQSVLAAAQERLPDIASLLHACEAIAPNPSNENTVMTQDADAKVGTQNHILLEQTLRVCWMLQELLQSQTTLSTNEMDKLFRFSMAADVQDAESDSLTSLSRLHAIRTIATCANAQGGTLDLFARSSSTDRSFFYRLLQTIAGSAISPSLLQSTSLALVRTTMQNSALFEHDQSEWQAWQYALCTIDHSQDLIDFFDECTQRCLKTVYRYIEMARSKSDGVNLLASPLLFTMLEQYSIRMRKALFNNFDVSTTFVDFLLRLLPALCVQGTSADGILSLVQDCQSAVRDSDEATNGDLQAKLLRLMDFIDGLSLVDDIQDNRSRGRASRSNLDGTLADASGAYDLARRVVETGRVVQRTDWDTLSTDMDAKLVVLAIACRMQRDPTVAQQFCVSLQAALEHGALDYDLLSRAVFANRRLLAQASEHVDVLHVIAKLIAEGPFDDQKVEDLALVRDSTSAILQSARKLKNESAWRSAVDVAAFMDTDTRRELIKGIFADEKLAESLLLEAIEKGVNDDKISDEDVIQMIENAKVSDAKRAAIVRLLCSSESTDNDRMEDGKTIIIQFLIERSSDPNADAALLDVLRRYPEQASSIVRQFGESARTAAVLSHLPLSFAQCIYLSQPLNEEGWSDAVVEACSTQLFAEKVKANRTAFAFVLERLLTAAGKQTMPILIASVPEVAKNAFCAEALSLASTMVADNGDLQVFARLMAEKALLWLVRRFAEDAEDSYETLEGMDAFIALLLRHPTVLEQLAHLAEPVINAAVRNRLHSERHVHLVQILMINTPLSPTIRQTFLDSMLRDRTALMDHAIRSRILATVAACIERDDAILTSGLASSLVNLYGGSLGVQDRQIFETFCKFEQKSNVSLMALLVSWRGDAADVSSAVANASGEELIWRLDANRVLETCLRFPRARSFSDLKRSGYNDEEVGDAVDADRLRSLYDPLLLLGVLGQLVMRERPLTGLEVVQLLRTNVLGSTVCCLSSRCANVRSTALTLLAKTYACICSATFHEKDQLMLVFDALRDALDVHGRQLDTPLALTMTLFVAHALRAQAQPSLYLYPLVSRFLLQRSSPLDKTDVPLLYNFLYASSQQSQTHRHQRIFIVRFLAACLRYGGRAEWQTMQRRHVWHSVCSMYTTVVLRANSSSLAHTLDDGLRRALEDFFNAAASRQSTAYTIVVRLGFLQYIDQCVALQYSSLTPRDCLFWMQLLCTLLLSLDHGQVHSASNGEWLSLVCSSLSKLMSLQSHDEEKWNDLLLELPDSTVLRIVNAMKKVCMFAHSLQHNDDKDDNRETSLPAAWSGIVKDVGVFFANIVLQRAQVAKSESVDDSLDQSLRRGTLVQTTADTITALIDLNTADTNGTLLDLQVRLSSIDQPQ